MTSAINPNEFVTPVLGHNTEQETGRSTEAVISPVANEGVVLESSIPEVSFSTADSADSIEAFSTNPTQEELVETVGFLRRIGRTAVKAWDSRAGTGLKVGIVAAEVLPINEAMRFIPAGAVQVVTNNSFAGGLTVTALTALVEGGAAYASADLMETGAGKKVFEWLHKKTNKVLKGRKVTDNPAVEILVTYGGGSAVIMAAKKTENPDMTKAEILREGKFAAGWLAPVVGVQWVAGANAIQNPTPGNIMLGLGTTVGMYASAKVMQRRNKKNED